MYVCVLCVCFSTFFLSSFYGVCGVPYAQRVYLIMRHTRHFIRDLRRIVRSRAHSHLRIFRSSGGKETECEPNG